MTNPSDIASSQYANTTDKLKARIAIYQYSTNPQSWFDFLKNRLQIEGTVLEVGAGTGELWRHVDHFKAQLTLTDFSPAMCDALRSLEIPDAVVKQCDAAHLPFEDDSFDTVIANHMLYHVDDPDACLKEFARILKSGGQVIVSLNGRYHVRELVELSKEIRRPGLAMKHAKMDAYSAQEFLDRYFTDVGLELFPGQLEVPTAEPVLAYLNSLGATGLSDEQRTMAEKIVREKIAEDGNFKVRTHTVLLTARAT